MRSGDLSYTQKKIRRMRHNKNQEMQLKYITYCVLQLSEHSNAVCLKMLYADIRWHCLKLNQIIEVDTDSKPRSFLLQLLHLTKACLIMKAYWQQFTNL